MSQNTVHMWSAIASIATAVAVVSGLLGFLFRGGRYLTRFTSDLVAATRANTAAIGELTASMSTTSGDVNRVAADVGQLTTQTAINTEHIKHNSTRITKIEREIRA